MLGAVDTEVYFSLESPSVESCWPGEVRGSTAGAGYSQFMQCPDVSLDTVARPCGVNYIVGVWN